MCLLQKKFVPKSGLSEHMNLNSQALKTIPKTALRGHQNLNSPPLITICLLQKIWYQELSMVIRI